MNKGKSPTNHDDHDHNGSFAQQQYQRNELARKSLTEEDMKKQEKEDDADLKRLKDKLKKLADQKPPDNKDDLIQHLMERLQQAEHAIVACEEVITHERLNRKEMSKDLKEKNNELREIVNKEKRRLQDKVHDELEKTLEQALKEKMKAEKDLHQLRLVSVERNTLVEELDSMYLHLRDQHRHNLKLTIDQQKIIEHLEDELQQVRDQRDRLQHQNDEKTIQLQKANQDLDEAYALISKMEEARIVLNRLLGQNGVITERERQKFLRGGNLSNEQQYNQELQGGSSIKRQPTHNKNNSTQGQSNLPPNTISNTSNKMLTQNNQYFYGDQQQQHQPKVGVKKQAGYGGAPLMDDANEDDFWYQTPKGTAGYGANAGINEGGPNDYQGYINNQSNNIGGNRVSSRRGGKQQY